MLVSRAHSLATMSPSAFRLTVLFVVGVAVAGLLAFVGPWQLAVLGGWIAGSTVYLLAAWRIIGRADGEETKRLSTIEDDSRATRGLIIVSASVVSLPGAALALKTATESDGGADSVLLTIAAIAAVVVSWFAVHTDFTLRYAHAYYSPPVGGIEFAGVEHPDYRDFAYVAFTVGMSFAVPDTQIVDTSIRKVGLGHALLSYLFGTVVIAVAVNVVTNLGQG
jgi:uncharacterized membrane protein